MTLLTQTSKWKMLSNRIVRISSCLKNCQMEISTPWPEHRPSLRLFFSEARMLYMQRQLLQMVNSKQRASVNRGKHRVGRRSWPQPVADSPSAGEAACQNTAHMPWRAKPLSSQDRTTAKLAAGCPRSGATRTQESRGLLLFY